MQVGKIEQLTTDSKPPRTMPRVYQFARQEQTIRRLQTELDAANDRIVELTKALDTMNERQRQEWARAENAEAWAQRACNFLKGLCVDLEIETMILRLLEDAPESVKGGAE